MSSDLIEVLEMRRLLSVSVSPLQSLHPPVIASCAPQAARAAAKLLRIVGTYTGTLRLREGNRPFVLRITSEQSNGGFKAQETLPGFPTYKLTVTGQLRTNRRFTMTYIGTNTDGTTFRGSGSGLVSVNGKSISASFKDNTTSGTFNVSRSK